MDRPLATTRLRVVGWNANQGVARKASRLLALAPDVAVLSECGDASELGGGALIRAGWTGRNRHKGLGVYVRSDLAAAVDEAWDPLREWFLPVRVDGPIGIDVIAVWAMNHRGKETGPRLGRTHRALEHYASVLGRQRAVVLGDFNDNGRWDKPSYPSWERTEAILGSAGYRSVYHARSGEASGAETAGSLFWYRHRDRPYLVDHAFVPEPWLPAITSFEIGRPEDWLDVSDHVPLILDLDLARIGRFSVPRRSPTSR